MADFRRDVLQSVGVLQWLIETTGMAEDEMLMMVEQDFERLILKVS